MVETCYDWYLSAYLFFMHDDFEAGPSVQDIKAIWDVLATIEMHAGVPLPDGQTTDKLLKAKAGEVLDVSRKVAEDDEFWKKVPDVIVHKRTGHSIPAVDVRRKLRALSTN